MKNDLKTISIAFAIVMVLAVMSIIFWRTPAAPDFSSDIDKLFGAAPVTYDRPLIIKLFDQTISILPIGAQSAKAQTAGNVVKYIDAYQNTDVVQTKSFNKLKEDIILKQPGHPAIFEYQIDLAQFDVSKDDTGNLYFFQKGHQDDNDYKRFTIPAPFLIDADGQKSSPADVVSTLTESGRLTLKPSAEWLAKAKYPVILDPTIEINVINVHSHPQQGDNWTVDFTTQGTADLKIIPNDQATIDDDEFVSLSCNGKNRQAQILANDIIYYPNWNCDGTSQVIHYTKTAGKHTLRFEFGLPGDETNRQISYAYNTASSPVIFRTAATDAYTKLLLHADGTGASFIDSESVPKTITAVADATQSATQSKFGGKSAYFDGTGDWIETPDNADFAVGIGDWTVDFWFRYTGAQTTQFLFGQVNSAVDYATYGLYAYTDATKVWMAFYSGSTNYPASKVVTYNDGLWHHFAGIRHGNNLYVAFDGVLSAATDVTGISVNDSAYKFSVGRNGEYSGLNFNGNIDEFRISKGIARWTTNFTPPTSAYSSTGSPVILK